MSIEFDDGAKSRDAEVESLRQQLAAAQEREQTNDILLEQQGDKLAVLNDQLADSQKQVTLLRDALTESRRELDSCQKVVWLASDYGFDPAYVKGAQESIRKTDEALAATANLEDMVLCHAVEVGWVGTGPRDGRCEFSESKPSNSVMRDFNMKPLYRAWELKS